MTARDTYDRVSASQPCEHARCIAIPCVLSLFGHATAAHLTMQAIPRLMRHRLAALAGLAALVAVLALPLLHHALPAAAADSTATPATAPEGFFRVERSADSYVLNPILRVLEDPSGALTIEDVSKPEMQARFHARPSARGPANLGYSDSAFWLQIPLALAADTPARWQLEIAFAALDRVDLYSPSASGRFDAQTAGDLQPFSERPFAHRNLVFPLTLKPGASQSLYLRVQSGGSLTVPVRLWRPQALHEHDQKIYAVLSIYYGMLLALLLYNLMLYLSTREAMFLAYSAFVASMAVGMASLNGLANQFLWPDFPAWGNIALPVGMSAAGLFGALFTRAFLDTRRAYPRIDRLTLGLAAVFAFAALSPLFASYQITAIFASIAGAVFAAIATAIGIYCQLRGHPGARYFLLAWSLLLAGIAVLALRNLGWLPTNGFTVYSMQIGSALEMLLLSFALADRINVLRREKQLATQDALAAKEAMLENLRRSEQELESRVAERTRELVERGVELAERGRALEDANARLRENERALEHMARHDALTGLPNRTLLNDRIEHAVARARRSGRHVALLMIDMDGFKLVNDLHGHSVGDQMLEMVAERLGKCVRETDTVARFGGDEFVILLEDLLDRNDARGVADKLIASINEPFDLTAGNMRVGVSVGIAYFPKDAPDAEHLLRRADMAMYAAKKSGRNRWQVYTDV